MVHSPFISRHQNGSFPPIAGRGTQIESYVLCMHWFPTLPAFVKRSQAYLNQTISQLHEWLAILMPTNYRDYRSTKDSSFVLTRNGTQEHARLNSQHTALRFQAGKYSSFSTDYLVLNELGSNYFAPIPPEFHTIVDLCCGGGQWIMEVGIW
jgi:hypothetical protein